MEEVALITLIVFYYIGLGGVFVKQAIDCFIAGRYFWFGVYTMSAIYMAARLVKHAILV